MGMMGYRKRTGFLAGLTVAQISEFSLIFMTMGLTIGHVTVDSLGLVTLVGLITISLSVYMITYSPPYMDGWNLHLVFLKEKILSNMKNLKDWKILMIPMILYYLGLDAMVKPLPIIWKKKVSSF